MSHILYCSIKKLDLDRLKGRQNRTINQIAQISDVVIEFKESNEDDIIFTISGGVTETSLAMQLIVAKLEVFFFLNIFSTMLCILFCFQDVRFKCCCPKPRDSLGVGDSEDVRVSSRGRRLLKKKMFDV